MYALQDAFSPWVWIYFVLLVIIGSLVLLNVLLAIVLTKFNEAARLRQQ